MFALQGRTLTFRVRLCQSIRTNPGILRRCDKSIDRSLRLTNRLHLVRRLCFYILFTVSPWFSARPGGNFDSLWENKSPFSLLPKSAGSKAPAHDQHQPRAAVPTTRFSPFDADASAAPGAAHQHQQPITLSLGNNQVHGVRTLEEIEAEMREAFAAQRLQSQSPSQQQQQYTQGHLRSASAQRHPPPQYGQNGTPPPRMHQQHAQSPRFQQQQQQHQQQQQVHLLQQQQQQMQLLELQELRDRQQRQQLEYLQEQLRLEEMERHHQQQLRQQAQQNAHLLQHQRQASGGTPIGEMPYRRQHQQVQRTGTPSRHQQQQHLEVPFQQSMQHLPREIQMQQKLLAEMAQAEFLRSLQGSPVPEGKNEQEMHDMLRAQAMQKIMEAERMEEKRKRKLEKIRYMVCIRGCSRFDYPEGSLTISST